MPGFIFPDQIIEELPKNPAPPKPRIKTKKDPNKLTFPDDLPIERIIFDLTEKEKVCLVTGKILIKIGKDVVQRFAHRLGSYFIKEIVRIKYASPSKDEGTIISANLSDTLLTRHFCIVQSANVIIYAFNFWQV